MTLGMVRPVLVMSHWVSELKVEGSKLNVQS